MQVGQIYKVYDSLAKHNTGQDAAAAVHLTCYGDRVMIVEGIDLLSVRAATM